MATCPICKRDPYEYVDVGVGYVPVAVNCCEIGYYLFRGYGPNATAESHAMTKRSWRIIHLRRSHSPRKKARAKRLLEALFDQ